MQLKNINWGTHVTMENAGVVFIKYLCLLRTWQRLVNNSVDCLEIVGVY